MNTSVNLHLGECHAFDDKSILIKVMIWCHHVKKKIFHPFKTQFWKSGINKSGSVSVLFYFILSPSHDMEYGK